MALALLAGQAAAVGQAGPHKDPAHQLHGGEDVGQGEEDVVDLLLQPELAQLRQDVVKGDLGGRRWLRIYRHTKFRYKRNFVKFREIICFV
jgi:hypothetical protein